MKLCTIVGMVDVPSHQWHFIPSHGILDGLGVPEGRSEGNSHSMRMDPWPHPGVQEALLPQSQLNHALASVGDARELS